MENPEAKVTVLESKKPTFWEKVKSHKGAVIGVTTAAVAAIGILAKVVGGKNTGTGEEYDGYPMETSNEEESEN